MLENDFRFKVKNMFLSNKKTFCILFLGIFFQSSFSMLPINWNKTYDSVFLPERCKDSKKQFFVLAQMGFSSFGYNDESKVDVLKIFNSDQNSLAMLKGFANDTPQGRLAQQLNVDDDDGIRGHFDLVGDFNIPINLSLGLQYFFAHGFSLGFHLPFYSMSLKSVKWQENTKNISAEDLRTKRLLTNNIFTKIKELGSDLDVESGWTNRSGIGDLSIIADWLRDFPQRKPILKNIRARFKGGLTLPTGKSADEDKLFALPFGNDGSLGVVFGAGIKATWGSYFSGSIDADFIHLVGSTRDRRIKTDEDQTELILLKKISTHKEFGFSQKFNLSLEAHTESKNIFFRTSYQYMKHGEDKLFIYFNDFSNVTANTAKSLEEWTNHSFLFDVGYRAKEKVKFTGVVPQVSFFYKLPFNGKRSVLTHAIGIAGSISF